ncbi:hypothetical protein OC835_007679 [Tilletia horrida]|nr:hypothetical protein OC835_007679 [Tilletia horrida]
MRISLLEDCIQRQKTSLSFEISRLQKDIQQDQNRLEQAMERLHDEFANVQKRSLERLMITSSLLEENQARDLGPVLSLLQSVTAELIRDVRGAETDLIRVESQLVGLNAWNVAWPEAMRAANGHTSSNLPPPQYPSTAPQSSSSTG